MTKTTPRFRIPLILLVVVAIATSSWFFLRGQGTEFVAVRKGPIVEAVFGLATVNATREYQLKLGITTTLRKRYVREGDAVNAGQILVNLDEMGGVKAPFGGTITLLRFQENETVFPQTPILTLTDLKDRYLTLAIEQQSALRIRPGQDARLVFESMRGKRFEGKVRSLFPKDGQFIVTVDSPTLPEEVLPGMTADVAIEVSRRQEALLIPIRAVSNGHIKLRSQGKVTRIPVVLGTLDQEWAEVLEPQLKLGDEVSVPKRD